MRRSGEFRRAQQQKWRKRVARVVQRWAAYHRDPEYYNPHFIGIMANTRKRCSCVYCQERRRYVGPPIQERRQLVEVEEQLEEMRQQGEL